MTDYYFKINKTNGTEYVQIWKRVPGGKDEYVDSVGSPKKALSILVELKKLKEQTKKYEEILTKNVRGDA
jgi:hypothetical protein